MFHVLYMSTGGYQFPFWEKTIEQFSVEFVLELVADTPQLFEKENAVQLLWHKYPQVTESTMQLTRESMKYPNIIMIFHLKCIQGLL